jgi:small subunit ribosomal protein S1
MICYCSHFQVVKKVQQYGAYIDVGAKKDGFLHVSSISSTFVPDAQDVFVVGEEVKVRDDKQKVLQRKGRLALTACMVSQAFVTKVDRDRISLSTKLLEPSPGDMLRDKSMVFAKAEETVQHLQRTGQLVRREVAIPETDAEVVVGKGGTGLRDVTKESGADLSWISKSTNITVWGNEEQVSLCW